MQQTTMDTTEQLPAAVIQGEPGDQQLGRREKRKLEIRDRIERAAYDLFRRQGIDDVSIEQICDAAKVARRTFYGHYPNKTALLQSLSYSRVWFTADDMMQRVMNTPVGTLARVEAMLSYMEDNLASYSDIDRALILAVPGNLDADNHLRQISESLRDYLAGVFAQGQAAGDTTSRFTPGLLADMVMGTANTIVVNWALNPEVPVAAQLDEARQLFTSVIEP
ncbi:MAG: TetR/AcrR family transcriptional regulator [Pseudomonadota bacterium]